jgi:hypothetical protein
MALRSEYSLGNSNFNDFLFAFVGEEKNGADLTVLSALSRLDLDPWAEAARLSGLSKEAATKALATTIHTLPDRDWSASDMQSIAASLVILLPKHVLSTTKPSPEKIARDIKQMPEGKKKLILIAVGIGLVVVLFLVRLFGG